jgi:hypothetical protein
MATRRSFVKYMAAGATSWRVMANPSWSYVDLSQNDLHPSTATGPASGRPAWLNEGIVAATYMEPLAFYLRRGDGPDDILERWNEDFNDVAMKRYHDIGVNVIIMSLHKGMGLKTEVESIDAARTLTEIAHRRGVKVAGYIGSSMFTETFYGEEPDGPGWEQIDERGRPIYYGEQTYRHLACRNNPGYQAFLQKILRLGILDLKLDFIHFDQLQWWAEPWSCHCKYCQTGFRSYLRNKYTDDRLKARLGFTSLEGIRIPDFGLDAPPVRSPSVLEDPIMQEWALYRCNSLANWWGDTHRYIHQLNPDVALVGNPTMTPESNCGFVSGVDLQQLARHSDFIWSEEKNQPRWTDDGILVSQIRSYKSVRSMGASLFITQGLEMTPGREPGIRMEGPPRLRLAEAMAYNDLNLGLACGNFEFGSNRFTKLTGQYVDFFRSHNKDLVGTTPVTDVAILRSFASIEFNPAKSNVSTILFEQTLIQGKFPFGIIFDAHLNDLSKYKVVVLANQDALRDEQIDQIRRFVDAGGGLVVTEETSMRTEWRKRRRKFGLRDVIGMDLPPYDETAMSPKKRQFGKGRVVYIPRIEPSVTPPAPTMTYYFSNSYWKLPTNYQDLVEAVRWAARDDLSVRVEAPLSVTMELAQQKRTNTWLLHLLNFRVDNPVSNIPVQFRMPHGMKLDQAILESPDDGVRRILPASVREGTLAFTVPKVEVYGLVLLRMQSS